MQFSNTSLVLARFFILLIGLCSAEQNMCSISQNCVRDASQSDQPCPNVLNILNPSWENDYAPMVLNTTAQAALRGVCPFLDPTQPLCCNDDQTAIMTHSFQQIDSVFGLDVPLCGLNLKKFWCEFTCNPNQSDFVKGFGQIEQVGKNYTEIEFTVDEDMACTMFTGCKQVALIAQASLQSSLSFLNFLSVNGLNQSLSNFTFEFEGLPKPLDIEVYNCGDPVPANGSLDGYSNLQNSTCSFCAEMCEAPDIDASIGFFDGFDTKTVGITYGSLIAFSILWQVYVSFIRNPRIMKQWKSITEQHQQQTQNINQTASARDTNLYR